jgi:hypothetical protein
LRKIELGEGRKVKRGVRVIERGESIPNPPSYIKIYPLISIFSPYPYNSP